MTSGISRLRVPPSPRAGSPTVHRPVQYLGNKLRVLDRIVEAAEELTGGPARVADLFTGSTVVAQGLALRGHSVTAVDSQAYASVFATATLGIGRRSSRPIPVDEILNCPLPSLVDREFAGWESWAEAEAAALASGDGNALRAVYERLPMLWMDPGHPCFEALKRGGESALLRLPLLTSIYAGSYFGVRQALTLDRLRFGIERLKLDGRLDSWTYAAALTATMSAASAAAHSAGKHFAQPLNAGASGNEAFLTQRLLEDRRVDVAQRFERSADILSASAQEVDCGHRAFVGEAEEFAADRAAEFDLLYLDPPYTAQQYSRFYHLLETFTHYRFPALWHGDRITTGLYPTARYKSAFSSRTRSATAFGRILAAAGQASVPVLISYSMSQRGSGGNARMVSLEQLLDLCRQSFGKAHVEWHPLKHRYRQFNSSANANEGRDDPEILILCKAR